MLFHQGVGLRQRLEPVFRLVQMGSDVRSQRTIVGDEQGFPIVIEQFWMLRDYALFHNEF
jgi:hypothetical protein